MNKEEIANVKKAIRSIIEYLHEERTHFEQNPSKAHVWKEILVLLEFTEGL